MDSTGPLRPTVAEGQPKDGKAPEYATKPLLAGQLESEANDYPQTRKKRRFWSKLGVFALCTLSVGTVFILLIIAFLSFLWKGVDASSTSRTASAWRAIVSNNWTARSITLSSLVLRWAVGAQAGICTSMLAAFILESGGVPLHHVAGLSLLRNSSNGPFDLVQILLSGLIRVIGRRAGFTVAMLLASTALLQFSSTALLSDVGSGFILSGTQTPSAFYYRKSRSWYLYQTGDSWMSKPPSYPTFAELPASGPTDEPPSGLVETRRTVRALLPFVLPSERTLLVNYSGMSTIIESSVSCFAPDVNASLFTAQGSPRMWGTISSRIPGRPRIPDLPFNCTVPLQMGDDVFGGAAEKRAAKEWATGMCLLDSRGDPTITDSVWGNDTLLVFNMTRGYADVYGNNGNQNAEIYNISTTSADGPWARLGYKLNSMEMDLAMTICVPEMSISNRRIDAHSEATRAEPVLGWDPKAQDYKSEGIRRQLGAVPGSNVSVEERGLLRLSDNLKPGPSNSTELLSDLAWTLNFDYDITLAMCTYRCYFYEDGGNNIKHVHRAQVAVFQDILTTTHDPAQAFLAQYFTLAQAAYYEALPEFDDPANATATFYMPASMPLRWRGFSAVVAVLVVHFVCVILSTVLYLGRTRLSLLGNSWLAVAQVTTGDAEGVVAKASMATDGEIRRRIRRDNVLTESSTAVRLMTTNDGARAGLFRYRT